MADIYYRKTDLAGDARQIVVFGVRLIAVALGCNIDYGRSSFFQLHCCGRARRVVKPVVI